MRPLNPGIVLALVALCLPGCGSGSAHSRQSEEAAIAKAHRAAGFAQYSIIFPRRVGAKHCSVGAGPAGHFFEGACSTRVKFDGTASTVAFTQDFGTGTRHTWTIRVTPRAPARLVSQSGSENLVQQIP